MSNIVVTPLGRFRKIATDEVAVADRWLFECPGCGTWAYLDDDQWHGRVSVDHSGETSPSTGVVCSYHETHDYAAALADVGGEQQGSDDECICSRLSDLPDGTIIADLTCPVHGVEGSDPGDVLPGAVSRGDKPT